MASNKISSAPKCSPRSFVRREFVLFTPKAHLTFPDMDKLNAYVDQFSRNFPDFDLSNRKVYVLDIYELKSSKK